MKFLEKFFWQSIALLVLFLSILISGSGCLRKDHTVMKAESSPMHGLTRQEFYYKLYHEILDDSLLRDIYLPEQIPVNSVDFLCGEIQYETGTYQERMYRLRKEHASLMTIQKLEYRQTGPGGLYAKAHWSWRNPENAVLLWENLLSDFSDVSNKNREAVVFFCETGLARIQRDQNSYTLSLYPDEPISRNEADELSAVVHSYTHFIPINAIKTYDPEGNEILLCFSDPVSLFIFQNLISYMQSENEIIHSFLYFDETGTKLSLWINSASGGMFSIPLDLVHGGVCALPCSANPALIRQRLKIAASIIPECCRGQFSEEMSQTLQNGDRERIWFYDIGKTGYSVSVSYRIVEEYTGTISIGITKN